MAEIRHFAAQCGLTARSAAAPVGGGFRLMLTPEEESGAEYFAAMERGGTGISLSLLAVVEETFFRANVEEILRRAAAYEVCLCPERSDDLSAGDLYLQLSLRVFRDGLTFEVFRLALENLLAARDALEAAFP